MGQLKSDATYIYERDGDTVYMREIGADPSTRTEVGYDYGTYEERRDSDIRAGMKKRRDEMMENKLWDAIRREARTNPTLHDALDHAIMIYNLTKTT
jgi:hypothetical protein